MEAQINTLLEAHPLSPVLTSMPGVGVRTAAVLLVTVGDGTHFPTAAHLASYASLAPTTKQSGTPSAVTPSSWPRAVCPPSVPPPRAEMPSAGATARGCLYVFRQGACVGFRVVRAR